MNVDDYYKEYMQDIYARADSKEDFTEEQFTEEMCEFLVAEAVIDSYEIVYYRKSSQGIRIDAWNFEWDKKELCLFVCDFQPLSDLRSLTQTEIESSFKRAENFFLKSIKGKLYQNVEDS